MNIPKALNIHFCGKCKGKLKDDCFKRCGVTFEPVQYYFEYECISCQYRGRYILEAKSGMTVSDALRKLGDSFDAPEGSLEKGNITAQLNKIVGVQDLLKLGGKDAPRENESDEFH